MLRSRRRSLLCCALAVLLVHAFTPYPVIPGATNLAYAKKAAKKKRRKKKSLGTYDNPIRNYIPFSLTTSTARANTPAPLTEQPVMRTPRTDSRATRVGRGIHVQPVQTSAVNGPSVFSNSNPIEIPETN